MDKRTARRVQGLAQLLAFGAVTLAALHASAAEDDDKASVAQTCLNRPAIRRTKIINDRNILFVTRDGQNYTNKLPRQCPSLTRGSLINYTVDSGRLCAGGMFQVLWRVEHDNLMPTFICPLGMFVPVTEDEVADLMAVPDAPREKRNSRRRGGRDMVTATPIDLPDPPAPPATASPPTESPATDGE